MSTAQLNHGENPPFLLGSHTLKNTTTRGSARRAVTTFLAGLVTIILGLAVFPSIGRASGTPQVTFSVSTGLRDSQVITVRWTGFQPGENVYLRQCAHVNATSEQPDLANTEPVTNVDCGSGLSPLASDLNGSGLAYFPVMVTIGTGNSVPGDSNMICGPTKDCFLAVMTREQLRTPGVAYGLQRLVFSADPNSCPQTGQTVLSGGGTGAVIVGMPDWQVGVCPAPTNTTLDYVATKGDAGGRQDFLCGLRSFALTETPGPADEACFLNSTKRPHTFAPVANSSLVFAYNMRDKETHQRIEDLKLTPAMLAWVFTGQTLSWSSYQVSDLHAKEIATLNSGHVLPNNVQVIGRADQSSLNYLLTRFFIERAKDALWGGGNNFKIDQPTEFYPAAQGLDLKTTPVAVSNVLSQSDDLDGVMGWIGVMDAATAAYYGLPTVAIGTSNDSATATFVSSTPASVAKGISLMKDSGQGTMEADVSPSNPAAYPLPFTVFAELPTDSSLTTEQVASTTAWLKFVKNQDVMAPGYIALSDAQKTAIDDSLTKFTIQPTPSPSSSSGSGSFGGFGGGGSSSGTGTGTGGDTGGDIVTSEPVVAPISIFAQNVSVKESFSVAWLLLLLVAGIGATVFGAWQLSWGKKK